jgi:hypothetical protein
MSAKRSFFSALCPVTGPSFAVCQRNNPDMRIVMGVHNQKGESLCAISSCSILAQRPTIGSRADRLDGSLNLDGKVETQSDGLIF